MSSKGYNEVVFGEDSLADGHLADLMQDNNLGDTTCRANKSAKENFVKQSNGKTKKEGGKTTNSEHNKESPKPLKTCLQSSLSKLSAFERNTNKSVSPGDDNKVDNTTRNNFKTIPESTRISLTSEKRQHEKFEFKKPSNSLLNRLKKPTGCNEIKQYTHENRVASESRLTNASITLSLNKTAVDRSLEKCRGGGDSAGKLISPSQKERGLQETQRNFNDKVNIQNKVSTVKDLSVSLEKTISHDKESPISKFHPQELTPKTTGFRNELSPKAPMGKTTGLTQTVDEDSPIVRNRSKPKRPTISSPVSPACTTPVGANKATDDESPLIRRRSKVKKKDGDIVAIAESDEDYEMDGEPTEAFFNEEKAKKGKTLRRDERSRRKMILSDSEEEFVVGNCKKDNDSVHSRNRKMQSQASVKRKRQHCTIPLKKRRTHRVNDFLDEEAELSGSDIEDFSDDESECSELDSFIDDSTQLTQETPTQPNPKKRMSKHDMIAVYRQSLFSPHARDLNFRTPTMYRNKNRYKMKYGANNDGSASEAEETYARTSDLENELGSDSDCGMDESGDTLSLADDEEKCEDKESTPVASQVLRPLKRVKRKRILNESIEEQPEVTASACGTKTQRACPPKNSSFVTSSSLVNRNPNVPPTCESTPLDKPLKSNQNSSADNSKIIQNNSLSTTFEFDWGLDFSDLDLLHAVEDEKKVSGGKDTSIMQTAHNNVLKKSDVFEQEMQEIAFAMAATDDDVNLEMSEMPTFSLGFDLFGSDGKDRIDYGQTNTSANHKQNLSTISSPTDQHKAQFTKISPRSSVVLSESSSKISSQTNGNRNQNFKNNVLPPVQNVNNNNHLTGQNMKNIGLCRGHIGTPNHTFSGDQNMKTVGYSTAGVVKQNNILSSGQNVNKDISPFNDKSKKSELSSQQNIQNSGRSMFQNKKHNGPSRSDNIVSSLVQPTAQSNKWSCSSSSKIMSHTRTNGLKDVTDMDDKPGGPSGSVKSIPIMFVSPSQKDKGKLVMLADTKEISNSQIVQTLRRNHNIKMEVCQLQNCDYVVSNRMGVIRKLTSAVANGSNSTKILDKMRLVCDLYDRPCFIIEKDRVKPGETERDYSKSNAYVYTLACMAQTHIKVLFSQSQEETASLLTDLATLEAKKNIHIVAPIVMNKETQQVFRFLLTVPRVSYVTALNLCSSLRTLRDLFSCSPEDLQKSTRQLSESRAAEIHRYLRHEFTESMVNKNIRKNT